MYEFTSAQRATIQQWSSDTWVGTPSREPLYSTLLAMLNTPDANGTSGGIEAAQLRLWLRGAIRANQGVGLFSALIRNYTMYQAHSRHVASVDMQAASNAVGDNLAETLKELSISSNDNFYAPSLALVGERDAIGVGRVVFSQLEGQTAFEENSAWSGSLLFTMLGQDETSRLYRGSGSDAAVDTLDDLRNIAYAVAAFRSAVGNGLSLMTSAYPGIAATLASSLFEAVISGDEARISEFSAGSQLAKELVIDLKILVDTISFWKGSLASGILSMLASRLGTDSFSSVLLEQIFQGTPISPVNQLMQKEGVDVLSRRLANAYGISPDGGMAAIFDRLEAIAGSDAKIISLSDYSNAALVAAAKSNAGIAKAVQANSLIAFSTPGQSSVVDVPDEYLSQYWEDRVSMFGWRAYMSAYGTTGIVTSATGDGTYVDKVSGDTIQFLNTTNDGYIEFGGASADALTGSSSADRLYGGDGNDRLSGGDGDDLLIGGDGDDVLDGGAGADILIGGRGRDWLGFKTMGFGGESLEDQNGVGNYYDGGQGNDVINGTVSKDTYVFRRGDGQDWVTTHGGGDELRLDPESILESEVSFTHDGIDLIVKIAPRSVGAAEDSVRIRNWFAATTTENQLGSVTLGAKSWSADEISKIALTVHGTELNDTATGVPSYTNTYYGEGGNDTFTSATKDPSAPGDYFEGGQGNDVLNGGMGSDTYVYNKGDGADLITNTGGTDTLVLKGYKKSDVVFIGPSGFTQNLVIFLGSSAAQITWSNWFGNEAGRAASIVFDDGVLTQAQITAAVLPQASRDASTRITTSSLKAIYVPSLTGEKVIMTAADSVLYLTKGMGGVTATIYADAKVLISEYLGAPTSIGIRDAYTYQLSWASGESVYISLTPDAKRQYPTLQMSIVAGHSYTQSGEDFYISASSGGSVLRYKDEAGAQVSLWVKADNSRIQETATSTLLTHSEWNASGVRTYYFELPANDKQASYSITTGSGTTTTTDRRTPGVETVTVQTATSTKETTTISGKIVKTHEITTSLESWYELADDGSWKRESIRLSDGYRELRLYSKQGIVVYELKYTNDANYSISDSRVSGESFITTVVSGVKTVQHIWAENGVTTWVRDIYDGTSTQIRETPSDSSHYRRVEVYADGGVRTFIYSYDSAKSYTFTYVTSSGFLAEGGYGNNSTSTIKYYRTDGSYQEVTRTNGVVTKSVEYPAPKASTAMFYGEDSMAAAQMMSVDAASPSSVAERGSGSTELVTADNSADLADPALMAIQGESQWRTNAEGVSSEDAQLYASPEKSPWLYASQSSGTELIASPRMQ